MSKQTYKRHDVFRRLAGGELVLYRCLELVGDGRFVVQSADRIRTPFSPEQLVALEMQFVELLSQEAPEVRSSPSSTLLGAIEEFDRDFGDAW